MILFTDICKNPGTLKVIQFIKILLSFSLRIIPVILIIFGTTDIFKSIISGNDDSGNKNLKQLLKRIISCVIIFLVPTIINITFDILEEARMEYATCWTNANSESIKKLEIQNANEAIAKLESEKSLKNIQEAITATNQISDENERKSYEKKINNIKKEITSKAIEERNEIENEFNQKKEVQKDVTNNSSDRNSSSINNEDENKQKNVEINGQKITLSRGNDRIYFINTVKKRSDGVTGSDAILIESNGNFAMIDTGISQYQSRVLKYLKDLGATNLEFVLITHAHSDHYGGYNYLISNGIKVKKLYIKDLSYSSTKTIIKNSKVKGIEIRDVTTGNYKTETLGDFNLNFYNTENKRTQTRYSENMNSIVTLATIKGKKIYFSADIGGDLNYKAAEEGRKLEIECAKKVGKVDVYKVSHHGLDSNNTKGALEILKPSYGVITALVEKPATSETKKRLFNYTFINSERLYYTGTGTVILTISSDGNLTFQKMKKDE